METTKGLSGQPAATFAGVNWKKSRRSNPSGNCVEIAHLTDGNMAIRDSKNPEGPALVFTPEEWDAFSAGMNDGEFRS